MAAGLSDHVWSLEEIVLMADGYMPKPAKRGPYKKREKIAKMSRLLAILGIAFLIVVVLTHVAERWHFFPEMGWGLPNSPGHYFDLASAVLGVALLLAALIWRQISN